MALPYPRKTLKLSSLRKWTLEITQACLPLQESLQKPQPCLECRCSELDAKKVEGQDWQQNPWHSLDACFAVSTTGYILQQPFPWLPEAEDSKREDDFSALNKGIQHPPPRLKANEMANNWEDTGPKWPFILGQWQDTLELTWTHLCSGGGRMAHSACIKRERK